MKAEWFEFEAIIPANSADDLSMIWYLSFHNDLTLLVLMNIPYD